jgi:hypothetical protein
MAAGTRMPHQLIRYWSKGGKGGAKIRLGLARRFRPLPHQINAEVGEDGKPIARSRQIAAVRDPAQTEHRRHARPRARRTPQVIDAPRT